MILRPKPIQFQTGGALNLAKNEPAPINITWKPIDISGFKDTALDIPSSMLTGAGGSTGKITGGLPSDIAYVQNQLDYYKGKIKTGLSGPGAADYSNTTAKYDSEKVEEWSRALAALKSREENYKAQRTNISSKGTKDDYAMSGNKVLVKNASTGQHEFIAPMEVLTSRVKDDKGNIKNQFTMLTIGEALTLRFNDPNFSGYNEETGGVLDQMFSTVESSEGIEKDMNNLFSKAGSINKDNNTFIGSNGVALSIDELIANIDANNAVVQAGTYTKTNEDNLRAAVSLFTNDMSEQQKSTLTAKAMAEFISQYGKENKTAEDAAKWVNTKVLSDIAKRASIFLNSSQGKTTKASGGTKEGTGGLGDDLSKKEMYMNLVTFNTLGGTGQETVKLAAGYDDASDLKRKTKEILAEVPASSLNIKKAVIGTTKDTKIKDAAVLANNQFISDLTEDVRNNLFLGDDKSTPVHTLNHGNGLTTSAVNISTYGGNMKILRGMPYTIDPDGRKRIAWDRVKEAIDWDKEFKKRTEAQLKVQKTSRLTREERAKVIEGMEKDGFTFRQDPSIKTGNIAMIPIVTYDTDRAWDDEELDSYMQSGVSGEEKDLIDEGFFKSSGNIKRTYAFTVLSENPAKMQRDAYGPAMEMKDKVNIGDILKQFRTLQSMNREGYDFLDSVIAVAENSPITSEQ